ncbi:hypothetical protein AOLI_G00143030 [Acnodon oligacanthus]
MTSSRHSSASSSAGVSHCPVLARALPSQALQSTRAVTHSASAPARNRSQSELRGVVPKLCEVRVRSLLGITARGHAASDERHSECSRLQLTSAALRPRPDRLTTAAHAPRVSRDPFLGRLEVSLSFSRLASSRSGNDRPGFPAPLTSSCVKVALRSAPGAPVTKPRRRRRRRRRGRERMWVRNITPPPPTSLLRPRSNSFC